MSQRTMMVCAVALAATVLSATMAWAQGADAILGTWEELSEERGEFVRADFGEDGMVTIEVFDCELGFYLLDEEQHLIAIYETEKERENLSDDDWVSYKVQGERLTVSAGPEETVVFRLVERPEKTKSAIVGRWELDIKATDSEWVGEQEPQMLLSFNNDGTGSYMQLDELIEGSFMVDPEMGTIELTMQDVAETGSYTIEGDTLTIVVDEDTHVFTRVK